MALENPDDVSTWTKALWNQHRQSDISDRHVVAHELARRLALADSLSASEGKVLMDDGFYDVVLDILNDEFLCGFSDDLFRLPESEPQSELEKRELEERQELLETYYIPYMTDIFVLFRGILEHIANASLHTQHVTVQPIIRGRRSECEECNKMKHVGEIVITNYTTVLESLWRVAHPLFTVYVDFLSSRPHPFVRHECLHEDNREECEHELALPLEHIMGRCWIHLVDLFQRIGTRFEGKVDLCIHRHAYLMLCIWVYGEQADGWALRSMISAIEESVKGVTIWQFFAEAVDGTVITKEDVFQKLTWYMSTMSSSGCFSQAVRCLVGFRPDAFADISVRGSGERALLWFTMAACRTMLCSPSFQVHDGMRTKTEVDSDYVLRVCNYLVRMFGTTTIAKKNSERPHVPELWVYSMIVFAATFTSLIAKDKMNGIRRAISSATNLTWDLARKVRYYMKHPSSKTSLNWTSREPASLSVRRFTRRAWKSGRDELMSKRAPTQEHLRSLYNAWRQLGEDLETSDVLFNARTVNLNVRDFEPLERCAFDQCECSVFESTHPMKACRGCFLVAYCNEECQRKDWENHRETCGRI